MIILIGGEKGGTGKTTLATNIAVSFKKVGSDVLLVDTDKQGSASSWSSNRDEDNKRSLIPTIQKFGTSVFSAVKDLSKRFDDIVIDAGGRDSIELRSAMTIADIMYIPLQASQFDIWTISAMDKLVEQAQCVNHKLCAYIVINRASTNPSVGEVKEAHSLFEEIEFLKLSKLIIKDRIAYRKAARNGCAVFEMNNPDLKAVEEINLLFKEIYNENNFKAA